MVTNRKGGQKKSLRASRRENVTELLSAIEKQLKSASTKATLADFVRLAQLERDLEDEEEAREIIVTWVDMPETPDIAE